MTITRRTALSLGGLSLGSMSLGALSLATPRLALAQGMTLQASYSLAAYRDVMEPAARQFQDATGIRVAYRTPVLGTHDEHLQQVLRWGITGDLPDVTFQGNHLMRVLAERQLTVPLDPFLAAEPDWAAQGYAPATREVGAFRGRVHGLPFQVSVPVVFVNADLAARAGADPEALPQDWPGLLALAARINAPAQNIQGGHFDIGGGGSWTWQSLVTAHGGRMMDAAEQRITFDGPEGLEAMRIVRGFGQAGMVDLTQPQMLQAFGAGLIGVMPSFNAALGGLERAAGERFRIRTVAWPLPSPQGRVPAGGRTGLILARDPARQQAAWRYLKFMTGPAVQTSLVRQTGSAPANLLPVQRPEMLGDFLRANPNQHAGIARVPALTSWFSFPGEHTLRINQLVNEHIRTVAILRRTPEDALAALARDIRPLLPA